MALLRVLVGVLLLASIIPSPAEACRAPYATLEESVKRSDAIFVGSVGGVQKLGESEFLIVFNVEEVLKGKLGKTVEVRGDSSTCGFGSYSRPGDRLLMFASGAPLSTSALKRNIDLKDPLKAEKSIATVRAVLAR